MLEFSIIVDCGQVIKQLLGDVILMIKIETPEIRNPRFIFSFFLFAFLISSFFH